MAQNNAEQIMGIFHEFSRLVRQPFMSSNPDHRMIHFPQLYALKIIAKKPGITMKELADCFLITPPSASVFIDRLVKYHWINRQNDPRNRKIIRLNITSAGRHIFKEKIAEKVKMIHQTIKLIPIKDQERLIKILSNLLSKIKKYN